MAQYRVGDKQPLVAATAFIAREATLVGEVIVEDEANVWFGACARGDNEPIRIGARVNIQEGAVLHADPGYPLTIGEGVSVGHQAMLHGCTIGANSMVGIQAVVMNGAVIGAESLVGAGAVVTERKQFPPRSLIIGAPAKVARQLSDEEVAGVRLNADNYVRRAAQYRQEMKQVD